MKPTLIDFGLLATNPEKALRVPLQAMTRAGIDAVSTQSDGKTKRVAGVKYREATIGMADSQTVTLRIKETGDIYQVLINGKAVPLKEQSDTAAAVQEVVGMLDKGRTAFQKRLAAMVVKPPDGMKTAAPKIEETLTQQVAEVKTQIAEAEKELADLQAGA